MNTILCKEDLSTEDKDIVINKCKNIAIDTETTGLNPLECELCLIQILAGNNIYFIKYNPKVNYKNLIQILTNENITKVFHNANFDIRFLMKHLGVSEINNVICTKIAAKLIRGLGVQNSLMNLYNEYLGITLNKQEQMSNWKAEVLSKEQLEYAANDVKYLIQLWDVLQTELKKKNLFEIARKCFDFLPTQAYLENKGIDNIYQY